MRSYVEDVVTWGALGLCACVAVIAVFMMFVYMPVLLMAERQCLANGYPVTHVTVALERYCSTLDGAVTVRVTPTP